MSFWKMASVSDLVQRATARRAEEARADADFMGWLSDTLGDGAPMVAMDAGSMHVLHSCWRTAQSKVREEVRR